MIKVFENNVRVIGQKYQYHYWRGRQKPEGWAYPNGAVALWLSRLEH